MGMYRRDSVWYIESRWRGWPRLCVTTKTGVKKEAEQMERSLTAMRDAGRRDLIDAIRQGRITLPEAHDRWIRNQRVELDEHVKVSTPAPSLRELSDRWFAWMRGPNGISRVGRPYGEDTIIGYEQLMEVLFRHLPNGGDSVLADITSTFLTNYREQRVSKGVSQVHTVNRHYTMLQSFLRYCEDVEGILFVRPKFKKVKEAEGRVRWLDSDEILAVRTVCPPDWWTLFLASIHTGGRISEVQRLRWYDVNLKEHTLLYYPPLRHAKKQAQAEGKKVRMKTPDGARSVFLTPELHERFTALRRDTDAQWNELVFGYPYGMYYHARMTWQAVVRKSKIMPATIHDLRHTFAVHFLKAGGTLGELQSLLGHKHPHMTMRYAKVVPNAKGQRDLAQRFAEQVGK